MSSCEPMSRALPGEPPGWLPSDAMMRRHYREVSRYSFYRCRLTEYLFRALPENDQLTVLDVGAGDGSMAALLAATRPHTTAVGVETFRRERLYNVDVPLVIYEGSVLPFADESVDVVLLSNVVHHAADQDELLREVCRVARARVLIKDHLAESRLDYAKLAFLDVLGNRRFGASTTGRYWSAEQWTAAFAKLVRWRATAVEGLTFRRGPFAWVFPNRLEVLFTLDRRRHEDGRT